MLTVDKELMQTCLTYWGNNDSIAVILQGMDDGSLVMQALIYDGPEGRIYGQMTDPVGTADILETAVGYSPAFQAFLGSDEFEGDQAALRRYPGISVRAGDARELKLENMTEKITDRIFYDPETGGCAMPGRTENTTPLFIPAAPGNMDCLNKLITVLFGKGLDDSILKETGENYMSDDKIAELEKKGCPPDELLVKKLLMKAGDETHVPFELINDPITDVTAQIASAPPAPVAPPALDVPAAPVAPPPAADVPPVDIDTIPLPVLIENNQEPAQQTPETLMELPSLGDAVTSETKQDEQDEHDKLISLLVPSDAMDAFVGAMQDTMAVFYKGVMNAAEKLAAECTEAGQYTRSEAEQELAERILKAVQAALEVK